MIIKQHEVERYGENDIIRIQGEVLFCDACGTVARAERTHFDSVDGGQEWICRVCDSQFIIPDEKFYSKEDLEMMEALEDK